MKLSLLLILLLVLIFSLPAITYTTDDSIDLVLLSGHFQEIGDYLFWVPLIYDDEDVTTSKETALDCLAEMGLTFAIVQKSLENYTVTSDTEKMKQVAGIMFPYIQNEEEYMAVINIKDVANGFDAYSLSLLNEDQRFERSRRIVEKFVVLQPMDYDY